MSKCSSKTEGLENALEFETEIKFKNLGSVLMNSRIK